MISRSCDDFGMECSSKRCFRIVHLRSRREDHKCLTVGGHSCSKWTELFMWINQWTFDDWELRLHEELQWRIVLRFSSLLVAWLRWCSLVPQRSPRHPERSIPFQETGPVIFRTARKKVRMGNLIIIVILYILWEYSIYLFMINEMLYLFYMILIYSIRIRYVYIRWFVDLLKKFEQSAMETFFVNLDRFVINN